jgi:hypothetical protein
MGVTPAWRVDGWMPVRVANDGSGIVDLAYLHGVGFDEPFFDQTVERAFRNPFRLLVRRRSSLEELEELTSRRARDPDGLILHVSRCGSTLLASALRAIDAVEVLSEPGPVHTLLVTAVEAETAATQLRRLLRAMAPDDPATAHVVKLDAWTTLDLPVVRAAFPDVPWVLVHRDPAEVLVSLQRQRGFHVIPGTLDPGRIGLAPEELATMSLDEYAATVLGSIMSCGAAAARAAGDRALVLDHSELHGPGIELAASHFGLAVAPPDKRRIDAVLEVDAKNPALPWTVDTERKRLAITPEVAQLAEGKAGVAHRALLELGRSSRGGA